jgi:hypothetical protein
MKLKHLGAFATGKRGERKNTEIAQRIAIPIANGLTQLKLDQSSYPTIPLEHLQSEGVPKENRNSHLESRRWAF